MSSEFILQTKDDRVAGAAATVVLNGFNNSLWEYEGNPSHGAVPPAFPNYRNPDNTTQGAVRFAAPAGGKSKWLTAIQATFGAASTGGRLTLYDRLLDVSGFSGNLNTVQNVNNGSVATLSRHYTDPVTGEVDVGNDIYIEGYTVCNTGASTLIVTYTNEAGVLHTTQALPLGTGVNRIAPQSLTKLTLAAGDRGVRSVTSVQLSAAMGAGGNFGIVVGRKLVDLDFSVGFQPQVWTAVADRFIDVTGCCLAWQALTGLNGNQTQRFVAALTLGEW